MTKDFTIYKISHILCPGFHYIGATCKDANVRFNYHKKLLRRGKHHAPKLQSLFNAHGEDNLYLSIVIEGNGTNKTIQQAEDAAMKEVVDGGGVLLNKLLKSSYYGHPGMSSLERRKRAKKKKLSLSGQKAIEKYWADYHAEIEAPNYHELPDPCMTIQVTNHMSGKITTLTFHPNKQRRGSFNVHLDGIFWKRAAWSEATALIRKSCKRTPLYIQ